MTDDASTVTRGRPEEATQWEGYEVTSECASAVVGATSTTIVLRGEIDAGLADRLEELAEVAAGAGLPVLLDVAAVTFMDSTGVAFVAGLVRELGVGRTTVLNPPEQVLFLLTLTQLTSMVRVVPGRVDPPD